MVMRRLGVRPQQVAADRRAAMLADAVVGRTKVRLVPLSGNTPTPALEFRNAETGAGRRHAR